jgi:hypothetical protein
MARFTNAQLTQKFPQCTADLGEEEWEYYLTIAIVTMSSHALINALSELGLEFENADDIFSVAADSLDNLKLDAWYDWSECHSFFLRQRERAIKFYERKPSDFEFMNGDVLGLWIMTKLIKRGELPTSPDAIEFVRSLGNAVYRLGFSAWPRASTSNS